jgi:hypothetical protein
VAEKPSFIVGRITLHDGRDAAGSNVHLVQYSPQSFTRLPKLLHVQAGPHGFFTLKPVQPGEYYLLITRPGYQWCWVAATVPAEGLSLTQPLTLGPILLTDSIGRLRAVGDFCDWNGERAIVMREREGVFTAKWPTDHPVRYKFIVDDERIWYPDPVHEYEWDNWGYYNSLQQPQAGIIQFEFDPASEAVQRAYRRLERLGSGRRGGRVFIERINYALRVFYDPAPREGSFRQLYLRREGAKGPVQLALGPSGLYEVIVPIRVEYNLTFTIENEHGKLDTGDGGGWTVDIARPK